MSLTKSESIQKFKEFLESHSLNLSIVEFSESTRTAQEAADTVGCELGQIVKSIIFKGSNSNKAILVMTSGVNRVNENKIAEYLGEPIKKANAQFVLEQTGYAIGGVPPFGYQEETIPFIDKDLEKYDEIWAAAGTPFSVFKLSFTDLVHISKGKIISVN